MKIYIACLAAYNSGCLHGNWIDVHGDAEEMEKEAQKVIKTSPVPDAEEWAIHDYDDFPNMGEYVSLEKIAEIADMIESSDQDADVVKAVIDNYSNDMERSTSRSRTTEAFGIASNNTKILPTKCWLAIKIQLRMDQTIF